MPMNLRTIPNQLATLRILLVPLLWIPAANGSSYYVGAGLVVAGITDFLDGWLARQLNQATEVGARLDTWADNLVVLSSVVWIFMLQPEIFLDNAALSLFAFTLYVAFLFVGWLKFGRFANLHLYSAKVAAATGYLFLVHAFLAGYSHELFYIAMGMFVLTNTEGLLLLLTRSHVNEHVGSILFVSRRGSYER